MIILTVWQKFTWMTKLLPFQFFLMLCSPTCPFHNTVFKIVSAEDTIRGSIIFLMVSLVEPFSTSSYFTAKDKGKVTLSTQIWWL